MQARLDELTTGNTSIMAQYQGLIWILQNYRTGDLVAAAKAFADASFDLIEDETSRDWQPPGSPSRAF